MTDIFEEINEDVRRERFNRLWLRYRWYAVSGAVLVVAATAGFVEWQSWQRSEDEQLGAQFSQASALAQADHGKAAQALEVLAAGGSEGYRLLARFQAANLKVKSGDKTGGVAALKAIAADGGVDQAYRDLATILAALAGIDTAPPSEVAATLQPLTIAPNPWRFTALELTALAKVKSGDTDGALKLYRELADDLDAPQSARARAAEILSTFHQQGS